jgi:hypothetical protein
MAVRWVDLGEASRGLGIGTDAVRKRIAQRTLEASRQDETVLLWLDDGGTDAGRETLRSALNDECDARPRR